MFSGAKNVVISGSSFVANAGGPSKGGLDKLVAEVAPNAILNAGGRADEVRCYPGTREEVIEKLEKFMDDESPGRKRMMWLSGPAGAGKSAICQTVAERRSEQDQQAISFFFFRGDSTRSHQKPLVATLVYQLRRFYPALDQPLSHRLETDPLICSASIEAQFKQLISSPFEKIQQSTPIRQQIVIIIDGLDECSNETRDQDQILVALHALAHADNSPFLILVSSRAEPHLVMSFNRLGSSVESIFLNDDYKPQKDIRLFVVAKFDEIKRIHHLAPTLGDEWPTDEDIDAIVDKSSGQFIYGATVMRYIQFSSDSPALSLVTILEMRASTDHNPLAHLDAVYSHIFSKVQRHNIPVVKLILFARHCTKSLGGATTPMFSAMLQLAGYKSIEVQSYFADLAAIIKVNDGTDDLLVFYHASLDDYLGNKSRSTIYHVNDNEIAVKLSSMCLRNIHDAYSIQLTALPLRLVQKPTSELSKSLLDASTKQLTESSLNSLKHYSFEVGGKQEVLYLHDLIDQIERLYWEHDNAQFKALLQSWSHFAHKNNINELSRIWIQSKNSSAAQYYKKYWMTEEFSQQEPLASTGVAGSNTRMINVKAFMDAAIGGSTYGLGICKPSAPPQDVPAAPPPKDGGGSSLRLKVVCHQSGRASRAMSPYKEEGEEYGNHGGESDNGPYELSMIRVKLHYQDDIRGMTLTPNTLFSEFADKVTAKFGKNFNDLTLKFKDKDGDKITLCDDSDYELAIEAARKSSKGKGEGMLKIWCQDNA